MQIFIHIIFTILSLGIAWLIFMISHENQWIDLIYNYFIYKINFMGTFLVYIVIFGILFITTFFSLKLSKKFDAYPLERKRIISFEQANDIYLPIYLGYTFVSISLPTLKSFLFFFLLMTVILVRVQGYYFNPLFLVWGYKFYFVNQDDKSKILLITKKEVKNLDDLFGQEKNDIDIHQINYYTYVFFD